jgi:Flp pilus assembly CpaF family ATPase
MFLDHEALLAKSSINFSVNYKNTCLIDYVANKLGRTINLNSACANFHIDTSKKKIHVALIDATLTAELLIVINTNPNGALTYVPQSKSKPRNKLEKFSFPRAYKGDQVNFCKT